LLDRFGCDKQHYALGGYGITWHELHYETSESIYAIDSRKVSTYGEIKDFYAWIIIAPHIIIVFNIVVVDLPPTYGVVCGRDWSSMIGGNIMNNGSCMMLPDKDGE
jgi:hypothetical protein